ncbi:unnamed protein product [Amoebophrya sp. A120]|nr:unnamed protein product [Amoebophrya sp. A120]|eukprot:GSA120T00013732001.1
MGAAATLVEPSHHDGTIVAATSEHVSASDLEKQKTTPGGNAGAPEVAPVVQGDKQRCLPESVVVENPGSFFYHDLIKTALLFFCLGMVAGLLLLSETHSRLGCHTVCE